LQSVPVEALTLYRDLDRGISIGGDLLAFRVPIKITKEGGIVILPGLDLGVRHYSTNDIEATSFHASLAVETRAARTFLDGWLSTGILGRLRLEAATSGMSGDEEAVLAYLALSLDEQHRMYARVYAGVERDGNRDDLRMPAMNTFFGLGIFGNLTGR